MDVLFNDICNSAFIHTFGINTDFKIRQKVFCNNRHNRLESNITCIMCSTCWQQLDICITACPTIVILILSCIYLGVNISKQKRNENIVSVENSKQKTQISLEQGAKELKNLKELFDIGVFSEQEYTLQKNKIFGAMGVERNTPKPVQSATQSTVAIPQTPTETIEQPSMNQIIPDGNYDVGAMILSLSMRTFTFTKKDTNANCSTGTFTYDNDGNVLTLFTTDGSKMQLSIDQNGNLVTPRGTTYRKI